jgi:hypothetical protein
LPWPYFLCHNPSLGLATKAKACKVVAKREAQESPHMLLGVQRVWGNEPSHSQVNPHCGSWSLKWTPTFLERNCRGQNPFVWKVLYIIGKLLKCRCLKWACMTHLDIWNTSYDQKKGRESNCQSNWQFDSQSLKVGNRPDFLPFKPHATYCWKALDEGYNFTLNFIVIGGLHTKLWPPKSWESQLGVSRQNVIWMWPRGELQRIL